MNKEKVIQMLEENISVWTSIKKDRVELERKHNLLKENGFEEGEIYYHKSVKQAEDLKDFYTTLLSIVEASNDDEEILVEIKHLGTCIRENCKEPKHIQDGFKRQVCEDHYNISMRETREDGFRSE